MREILFRGKRVDNGEWVYGLPCYYNWDTYPENPIRGIEFEPGSAVEVDLETIEQYIELTDRNGTKIFIGDILLIKSIVSPYSDDDRFIDVDEIEFEAKCVVVYNENVVAFDVKLFDKPDFISGWMLMEDTKDDFEVIGNIHDNPELLK